MRCSLSLQRGKSACLHPSTFSPTHRIDVFDCDGESGLTGRRPFAEIPAEAGGPDDLTVDEEGGVWVALYGGGAVRRYTPEGMLDEVIEVPAKQFTACTFGSSDLDELFITTSREGLEPGKDPLACSLSGALWALPVDGSGVRRMSGSSCSGSRRSVRSIRE